MWPKDITLITRLEWGQLLPGTTFYLIGLAGRNQEPMYDHGYHLEFAAWYEDEYYNAETFDRLLAANGITEITDENRELVAQAFAPMTIPRYLEKEVVFPKWEAVDMEPAAFNYCVKVWTQLQGLELLWCFIFQGERLDMASEPP